MNKKQTIAEYLKQPITDADKNHSIITENKESKKLYWLSLALLGALPFLNTLVEAIQMKFGINFIMKASLLNISISSLLIVNLLALAAYVIGMWSIRNVSNKAHPFAFTGLIFGIVFIMSVYQTSIGSAEILLAEMFLSKMSLLLGNVMILTMIYMLAVELVISHKVVELNNKNYPINNDTLSLADGFDENMLMNDDSKKLYQSIMKSGRKPYKFEHDMIIDMNLKEYEGKLQIA